MKKNCKSIYLHITINLSFPILKRFQRNTRYDLYVQEKSLLIFFFNFLGTHDLGRYMEKSVAYGSSRVRLKLRARLRSLHNALEIEKSASKIVCEEVYPYDMKLKK